MNDATLSALLLLVAGLLHSISLMCRQLPQPRRPALYPRRALSQGLIDLTWFILFLYGAALAFTLSLWLGVAASAIYFFVLPFVFQPPLAQMFGFKNLREYLDAVDRG